MLVWTIIAILPVFVLMPLLLWRYRDRNNKARYAPDWQFSGPPDLLTWGAPFVIIFVLSTALLRNSCVGGDFPFPQ